MRIATYNIQSADYGRSVKAIQKEITDLGVKIIGIQEIDNMANRSGKVNILTDICGKNFNYCEYAATMEFDGGHYGIGIASKYPMKLIKTVKHKTADLEPRVLMICEVNVDGQSLYVANTHLSYENAEIRKEQFQTIAEELKKYSPVVLFGDFNVSSFDEYNVVPLNKVNNENNRMNSFKGPIAFTSIDNILYDDNVEVIETQLNESDSSDHNLIWANIKIK